MVSRQHQASDATTLGEESRSPLNREVAGLQNPFGIFWIKGKSLASTRVRTLDQSARSLVTTTILLFVCKTVYLLICSFSGLFNDAVSS